MTQTVDTGSPLKSTEKRPQAANDTPPPEEKCSRHKATQPLPQPQPQAAAPPKRQPKKPVRRKATRPLVQQCQELLAQPVPQDFVDFAGVESLAAQMTGGYRQPLEVYETVLLVQLRNALKGDTRAAAFLRDSAQEKTKDTPPATLAPGDYALLTKLANRLQQEKKQAKPL